MVAHVKLSGHMPRESIGELLRFVYRDGDTRARAVLMDDQDARLFAGGVRTFFCVLAINLLSELLRPASTGRASALA